MKSIRIGLSIAACLIGGQTSAQRATVAPSPREIHVTNDARYRWSDLHLAVNPRNANNIAMIAIGNGMTRACQQSSSDCQSVPATLYPPVGNYRALTRMRGFYQNPNFMAVTVFYSFDRGLSWSRVRVPKAPKGLPALTGNGHPSLTVGRDGIFYASWNAQDWGTPERTLPRSAVAVSKSTDGGRTWSEPSITGTPVDGPKLMADLSSGMIYAASSGTLGPRASGNPDLPLGTVNTQWLASSKDSVRWTAPQPIGGTPESIAAAHGMLAVGFKATAQESGPLGSPNAALCGQAKPPCTIFQTTIDGGVTWTRHVAPVPGDPRNILVAANPARQGHFALLILPNDAAAWHVYQTRDAGRSWTGPAIVTDDPSSTHFLGNIAFSPQGVIGLIWGSRLSGAQAAAAAPYTIWGAISRDGGTSFSQPVKISAAPSPAPADGGTSGRSAVALDRDYFYAAWPDWRPPEAGGYFAALPLTAFASSAR